MVTRRSIAESASCVFVIHDDGNSLPDARQLVSQLDALPFNAPAKAADIHDSLQAEIAAGKNPALVLIALPITNALLVGRIVRRFAPTAELLFVVTRDDLDNFRHKLMHVPLGKYRIVPNDDAAALIATANGLLQVSKQRRSFRTTIDRINIQLSPRVAAEPGELRRLAISDRHRASILASAGDAIISVDKDRYVTAWNRSAEELFQVANPEGRLFEEIRLGECGPLFLEKVRAVFAGQNLPREEIRCSVAEDKQIEIEAAFAPVLDDDKAVIGVSIIARDVSAANRARRLLQVEHQVTRHLVEGGKLDEVIRQVLQTIAREIGAKVAEFWSLDKSKEYLFCAGAWSDPNLENLALFVKRGRELRLRTGEGLPGRVWRSASIVVVPDIAKDNNFPRAGFAAQAGLKSGLAFSIATENEFFGAMNFFAEALLPPDESLLQMMRAVGNDIAQYIHRLRAEQALQESAERMRFMAESMPQKIFTAKPSGEVDYCNQQWKEFTGLTFEKIRDWGWTEFVHPDDVEENVRRWKHSIETGGLFEFEHRFRRADGVYRWHLSRVRPMRDMKGNVLMWIGSNTDIEDQKRAEERLERTVADRTAKLRETVAELEGFSYSISHDMRAPLRAMQQYSQILLEEQRERLTGDGPDQLQRIMTAANRLDRLIQDILTYSRMARGDLPMESVDVDRLVRELIQHYPEFQKPAANVQIEGRLLPMIGHEPALTQCLSNLIGNAVKFVVPGTLPQVRIWTEQHGDNVRLYVEDNGVGISKENQTRIFDIFVRVYPEKAYAGTGIGLSIVRKAIQRMGGNLQVESELGKGSTFWIELKKG